MVVGNNNIIISWQTGTVFDGNEIRQYRDSAGLVVTETLLVYHFM